MHTMVEGSSYEGSVYETKCPECEGTGYEENPFGQLSGCGGANECGVCRGSGVISIKATKEQAGSE